MKPKPFYMLMLICCLALLSSANQNSSDCKKVAVCGNEKTESTCTLKTDAVTETTKVTPLNLFLFEL